MAQFAENPRIANLENALAQNNIAWHRVREAMGRLGYLIDPLVERRLNEALDALEAAKHYTARELVTGRKDA